MSTFNITVISLKICHHSFGASNFHNETLDIEWIKLSQANYF